MRGRKRCLSGLGSGFGARAGVVGQDGIFSLDYIYIAPVRSLSAFLAT